MKQFQKLINLINSKGKLELGLRLTEILNDPELDDVKKKAKLCVELINDSNLKSKQVEHLVTAASPNPEQQSSSKNTSVNSSRLPKAISTLAKTRCIDKKVVLDYGCGKFANSCELIEGKGGIYFGIDPFNLDKESNLAALIASITIGADFIVASNVLNVIEGDKPLNDAISSLQHLLSVKGLTSELFISIYEGDKSGVGKRTRVDQYQRNLTQSDFMINHLKERFHIVSNKGVLILRPAT